MTTSEKFGDIVKKYRNELKYSQEYLAKLSKLDRTTIVRIEKGERTPTLDTIYMISEALEKKPYELIIETYHFVK